MRIVLGWDYLCIVIGSLTDPTSGSLMGYVQVVIWKISTQLSCKWLA